MNPWIWKETSSGLPSSAIPHNSLAHGSEPFSAFQCVIRIPKVRVRIFSAFWIFWFEGHVAVLATPGRPRILVCDGGDLWAALGATETAGGGGSYRYPLVQIISNLYIHIYIYIVHSFKMLPFWFKPLLWITLLVVHWPMQILWYAASEIQMLMVCLV